MVRYCDAPRVSYSGPLLLVVAGGGELEHFSVSLHRILSAYSSNTPRPQVRSGTSRPASEPLSVASWMAAIAYLSNIGNDTPVPAAPGPACTEHSHMTSHCPFCFHFL